MKTLNATIRGTFIGVEDHGVPTFMVDVEHEDGSQAFGTYDLRYYGIEPILRTIRAVGAKSWENLKGKHCRVFIEDGLIRGIGHIVHSEQLPFDVFKALVKMRR